MRAVLSFAYLAKYFVFFIEWLHSKHLVINLFKFSLGERGRFFERSTGSTLLHGHTSQMPHQSALEFFRSRYIRRRRRLQLLDRTLHQQLA